MKKLILILGVLFLSGCYTTSVDSQAIYTINKRLSNLEKNQEVKIKVEKTIWLEMSNGSSKPIELTKDRGRWVGPLGEYYNDEPTKQKLEKLYKK